MIMRDQIATVFGVGYHLYARDGGLAPVPFLCDFAGLSGWLLVGMDLNGWSAGLRVSGLRGLCGSLWRVGPSGMRD